MPLPEELRNSKKGLINLKNEDDKCFLWCHVGHLNPQKKDPQRIKFSDREFAKKLDYSGITFPVTIKQIPKIGRQNETNINLFGYYQNGVFPIKISTDNYHDHIELLYIEGEEENHDVYIKDFYKLMFSFTKHEHKKTFLYALSAVFLFK